MKRVYKIVILFVAIFLIGILSFAGYINHSLDHKEELKAADTSKTVKKSAVKTIYLY